MIYLLVFAAGWKGWMVMACGSVAAAGAMWLSFINGAVRELYLCEPSDDRGNPFGLKFIRSNMAAMSNKPAAANGAGAS